MSAGFYKYEDGVWLYAPNTVINANYQLIASERDTYDLPIDGWDWYDINPAPSEEDIEYQLEKRDFGQRLIAEVMVETGVEGILQVNPQLGMTLMTMTESLFYALNNGFLILAIGSIKSIPPENIGEPVNNIINEDLLLRYRNKIHNFLNIEPVQNYND